MASVQVRYIVRDLEAAVAFYTQHLGFKREMQTAPAFAMLSHGDLRLVLSVPNTKSVGAQAMSDGTNQSPGGWNRFAIEVDDIEAKVESLRRAGVQFRNNVVTGVGGKQALLEDPSGNLIELFQPLTSEARLGGRSHGQ